MGRLFWKFFFFFWLAQLVTSIGVGVTIWVLRPEHGPEMPPPRPPFTEFGHAEPPVDFGDRELRGPLPPPPPKPSISPLLMPLIAGSVVSFIFAALLAWYFARPIRCLRQAFESVASGKLETRIGKLMGARHDELSDLGTGFDHMAKRLQGLIEGQRRLLRDVSHELRSPLARLQAAADLIRQQPDRGTEFVQRIECDTARMDALIGELLTLARLDANITVNLTEVVSLHKLITGIVENAQFEGNSKKCCIEANVSESLLIKGNNNLLHRAIENIVRNALKYSPESGKITITTEQISSKEQVQISITDQGKGVPDADLSTIFEPFFRGANADTFSSYGLGLSITYRIIEAHGGRITALNRSAGGLSVLVVLPLEVIPRSGG